MQFYVNFHFAFKNTQKAFHRFDETIRALTTFKLEREVNSLSGSSQGEVGDNREKCGDF